MIQSIRSAIMGLCITGMLSLPCSQSVSITGTVRDQNGQPLDNVTVSLAVLGRSTTTGGDGSYSFDGNRLVRSLSGKGVRSTLPVLDRGLLTFGVGDRTARIRIRLFDLKGKPVATVIDADMASGDYRLVPYVPGLAARVYLLNIRIGKDAYMMKLPVLGRGTGASSSPAGKVRTADRGRAGMVAVDDTLRLVRSGYSYEKMTIDSYAGVHDFTMTDTAWFWGDRSKIPAAKKVMTYVFLNRTCGRFTDEEMFWKFGDMPVRSFAEAPYYDMEANSSGRVYCYAGASNSKYNDFMEHTISSTTWNGNTTRVDAFVLPCAIRLHCGDGYDVISRRGIPCVRNESQQPAESLPGCGAGGV